MVPQHPNPSQFPRQGGIIPCLLLPAPFCLLSKSISKGFLALTSAVFMVQQFWGQAIDPCTNKALKQMPKGFPGHSKFSLPVNPGIAERIHPHPKKCKPLNPSPVPRTSQVWDSGTSRKCHRCGESSRKKIPAEPQSLADPRGNQLLNPNLFLTVLSLENCDRLTWRFNPGLICE